MIGKNSKFSPKTMSGMSSVLLLSLTFVAYAIVNAQTGPSDRMILKLNNTILDDPLSIAILTFSDGTNIFDTDRTSDPSTDSIGMTRADSTDSSKEVTTSSDSDSPTTIPTRTTSLDSSSTDRTGEVGTSTGEVGTSTGEVGTSTGEVSP